MLGITLRDHKRNTWIRHQTGVNVIIYVIKKGIHGWAGHIAQFKDNIPANMLTLGQRRQALALERQRRRRGDDVGPTLFRRWLATSHDDANPTSGDDVGSTLFRRRLATSQYDAKPTSGDDVGSTLFRRRLATSQYDAKPTSGDDVGSTLFPRR